ncbi:response regulator transcription factor [Synechococcus sp. PCC 7336]|uniref:response regulator n=1 Tax=Synechococcus sp. PCC 7336 TaxID=195250 RepID=UPI000346A312|nr:response regulator transcription factor [Synechococcus sp. PCC 7336]
MDRTKIVLIEDHALTRIGLRAALQEADELDVVGETGTAEEGLRLIEMHQPDVAVIDIGLPDMDGIELTQQLRQLQQQTGASQTKVLILTMHDDEEAVLAAFAAGADSYSIKDVGIDKLLEAVRATADDRAWIDPAIARVVLRQVKNQPRRATAVSPISLSATDSQTSSEPTLADETADDSISGNSEGDVATIAAIEPEYMQAIESSPLTERELEVLEHIVAGCSNAAIADKLFITVGTVKTHVRSIMNKLCANDRTQAAVRALRSGLVQ